MKWRRRDGKLPSSHVADVGLAAANGGSGDQPRLSIGTKSRSWAPV